MGFFLLPPAEVSYISERRGKRRGHGRRCAGAGGGWLEGGGGRGCKINHTEIKLHQNSVEHILDFETSEENNVAVTCGAAIDKL